MKSIPSAQFQTLRIISYAIGAARIRQRGSGGANAQPKGPGHIPIIVEAEQDSGGKGIAGPDGAGDLLLRNPHGPLSDHLAVPAFGIGSARKMNDDPFANTGLEQLSGRQV